MTTTTAQTVKDLELVSLGLVESASVNSISDFIPSKLNESKAPEEEENFVNTFICHLIFYAFFCVALVLHILIDLGLWSFIENKFTQLKAVGQKTVFEKSPAFA